MNHAAIQELLRSMNAEQLKAVNIGQGKAALIGAPGSGKTRCLMARIARLCSAGFPGECIAAVTFTRAAAQEMNERLARLGIDSCRVGTIHSLSLQILTTDWPAAATLQLVDEYKMEGMAGQSIGYLKRAGELGGFKPRAEAVAAFIENCKATGVCWIDGDPFGLNGVARKRQIELADRWVDEAHCSAMHLMRLYVEIESRRTANCVWTYDDMQLWAWMYLLANHIGRAKWRQRWSVVILDEAQDSTAVQWDMMRLLSGIESWHLDSFDKEKLQLLGGDSDPHNLMVAGDPSQSLYSFRYARPDDFVSYATSADTELCPLPRNYRSVGEICRMSYEVVRDYSWHLVGPITAERGETDRPAVELGAYTDLLDEASGIVRWCLEADGGIGASAVLCRLSAFLGLVEIECIRRQIPYVKRGRGAFTDSPEVKDLLAYLRVIHGSDPDDKSIRRVINAPYRYISRAVIDRACESVRLPAGVDRSLAILSAVARDSGISIRQTRGLSALRGLVEELHLQDMHPAETLAEVLLRTGYLDDLRARRQDEVDSSKVAMVGVVQGIAAQFGDVTSFLVYMSQLASAVRNGQKKLKKESNAGGQYLTLSTIHGAKGLEWDNVVVADVVAGRCPCSWSGNYEEEVRLFYVALSRAANKVLVAYSISPECDESPFVLLVRRGLKTPSEKAVSVQVTTN